MSIVHQKTHISPPRLPSKRKGRLAPPPIPRRSRTPQGPTHARLKRTLNSLSTQKIRSVADFAEYLKNGGKQLVHHTKSHTLPLLETGFELLTTGRIEKPTRAKHFLKAFFLAAALAMGGVWLATTPENGISSSTATLEEIPTFRSYRVDQGDTLGTIAERELGDPKRWKEIVSHNRSTLPDPNRLEVGMTLELPLK